MGKAYHKLISTIEARPWRALALMLAVCVAAVWVASGLRLDGDLGRLLPESSRSVQGLRNLERAYGDQIGRLTVVLQAPDVETGRKAAEALVQPLERLDGVNRVVIRDPAWHLKQLRLLYIDTDDLSEISKRLRKHIRWEKQRANPLFADLGGAEKPEVDLTDIEAKYSSMQKGREFYESPDGKVLVFVHPSFAASQLGLTKQLIADVESTTLRELEAAHPGVKASYTGRYKKRIVQQDLMTEDITSSTPIALIVLALFLVAYFRSFGSAIQVVIPLIAGTIGGMAFARVAFTNLNILTGFLAAILLGLGVDYGIHLVGRYHEVKAGKSSMTEAWIEAFSTSGRANIYSGLTTMLALGSLAVSSFRAFFEFGVIAMAGIAIILVSYSVLLPALIFLTARVFGRPRSALSSVAGDIIDQRLAGFSTSERPKHLKAMIVAAGLAIVAGVSLGALGIGSVSFDQSFKSLEVTGTESHRLDAMVNDVLGESQTPAVVLVENESHRAAVVETLQERRASDPKGYAIGTVLSLGTLIPTEQPEKLEIVKKLSAKIEGVPEKARTDELREFYREITDVLNHGEITRANLPPSVATPFSRRDSAEASVVLVMPAVDLGKAQESRDFARVIRDLPGAKSETIDAISDAQLLADIIELVLADTSLMVGLTLFGLLIVALVAFRSFDSARLLGNLTVAVFVAMGLVGFAGLEFNFINVLIIPIWLGLGVDASFHILVHLRAHPGSFGTQVSTALSVSAAFLTSMIGFGALMTSRHSGLSSLGQVAVLGLASIMIVSVSIAAIMAARAQLARIDDGESS